MKYIVFGLLLFTSSSYALPPDWNYAGRYSEVRDDPIVQLYLMGAGRGLLIANSALSVAGRQKLYCQPSTVALSGRDYIRIFEKSLDKFREKIEAKAVLDKTEDEMVLFYGLVDTFPCPKKQVAD